jgi:shikimate kinase
MQVYLVGFMGAGKSYLGNILAEKSQLAFFDLDQLMAEKFQQSIAEIFQEKGEAWFRQEESKLLLSWQQPGIIASGGGVIELKKNREFLKQQQVIWLDAEWNILWQRIKDSQRPLVQILGEAGIRKLYEKRKPLYEMVADYQISSASLAAKEIDILSQEIWQKVLAQ